MSQEDAQTTPKLENSNYESATLDTIAKAHFQLEYLHTNSFTIKIGRSINNRKNASSSCCANIQKGITFIMYMQNKIVGPYVEEYRQHDQLTLNLVPSLRNEYRQQTQYSFLESIMNSWLWKGYSKLLLLLHALINKHTLILVVGSFFPSCFMTT